MDVPRTSSHSGPDEAAALSVEAILSGRTLDVGGVSMHLTADRPDHAHAMAPLVTDLEAADDPPAIWLRWIDAPAAAPASAPDEAIPDVRAWHTDGGLVMHHSSGLVATVEGAVATLTGSPDEPATTFHWLFPRIVSHLLASIDRWAIHAAATVGPNGALVALGETGTGKSSLAAAALAHGWPVLADDLVVIRHAGDTFDVCGVPRRPAVPAELGLRVIDHVADADHRGRVELPADVLERGWFRVRGLVHLGHGPDGGAVEPIAPAPRLSGVLDAFSCNHDPALLRRFFPVATALARLPAFRLAHDRRPADRLATAGRLLDEIAELVAHPQ